MKCILWRGSVYPNGYGKVYREGRPRKGKRVRVTLLAHRVAYELEHGPARGKLVVHSRRCSGNKRCVNPAHLELALSRDRMVEWRARKR